MKIQKYLQLLSICFFVLVSFSLSAAPVASIPAEKIEEMRKKSGEAAKEKSRSKEKRRACKRVVRTGKALIKDNPTAANRFELLGIMLQNQKIVLELEKKESNRKTLFDICDQLKAAPDKYSKIRLEADLLLADRDLTEKNASTEERGKALVEMIESYEGTDAEPKSLMIGAVIAKGLESDELLRLIEYRMNERCPDNPEVIAFRRDVLSLKSMRVKCKGQYRRSDGTILNVPGDRIGHQCLLVYWSKEKSIPKAFMEQVKKQQEIYPGMFDVYSFNLDELPDAGEKILRDLGLDWQAMHLPKGKKNPFYQAYGGINPVALFVNSFGYTVLNPLGFNPDTAGWRQEDSGVFKISESRLSHKRYLAQLQSVLIGDFLVNDFEGPFEPTFPPELKMAATENKNEELIVTKIPKEKLQEIQDCFVRPPFRYRISTETAIENYRKAEKLCSEVLKQHSGDPGNWIVRNRKIIALLGLWNLLCEKQYLEDAVKESKIVLDSKLPPAATVVAQFCLARNAFRDENINRELYINKLVFGFGGDDAPVSVFAAAAILALEAENRPQHEGARSKFLSAKTLYPMWDFQAFLNNQYHRFYLLRPNTTRGDRMGWSRSYIVNHGRDLPKKPLPDITLENLDGSDFKLPDEDNMNMTLLLFVEPPADPEKDFPFSLDRKGNPTKNDDIRRVIKDATILSDTHVNKSVDVVIAFLCDDPERVENLMQKNEWKGKPVMVPGGLKNQLVRHLGIVSADKVPNVFLLRRNGTIAWLTSGLKYKQEFGYPFALMLGMKVHIEVCEVYHALRLLEKGDFEEAKETFQGPYTPARPDRFAWLAPRNHGRTLALMGLKDWENALEAVEVTIDAHKRMHYRYPGRGLRDVTKWRPPMAETKIKESCDVFAELWKTKAIILEKLDRKDEAAKFRKLAAAPAKTDKESSYKTFHEKLKVFRKKVLEK